MKKNIAITIILSLLLSGCTTYRDSRGNLEVADSVCSSGACPLLIIGMFAGFGAMVAAH